LLKTEEIGSYTRLYWRSGISSTRVRNSTSFHSLRYVPLVKRISHTQIFNRDSCKNLLIFVRLFFFVIVCHLTRACVCVLLCMYVGSAGFTIVLRCA